MITEYDIMKYNVHTWIHFTYLSIFAHIDVYSHSPYATPLI